MTTWRICTCDRGVVIMDDDEYLRTIQRFLQTLVLIAETPSLGETPAVAHAKIITSEDLLAHQRALLALIDLAKAHGLNDNLDVNEAKELIRCRVLGCGLAGACDGAGSKQYPCPLKEDPQ